MQKEYAKLAAPFLKVDADTVLAEISRIGHYRKGPADSLRRVTRKPSSKVVEAEKNLIALAAQDKDLLALVKEQMSVADFNHPEAKAVAELLLAAEVEEAESLSHFLLENLPSQEAKKFLSRLLVSEHLSEENKKEEILNDCVEVIKQERLKNRIEDLKLEIQEAEKAGETKKVAELLSSLKGEISK